MTIFASARRLGLMRIPLRPRSTKTFANTTKTNNNFCMKKLEPPLLLINSLATKLTVAIVLLTATLRVWAQDACFIVADNKLPYKNQTWFYCNAGNELRQDKIKENWDKGYRITAASYTSKGWFVVMSKNSGITMQTYHYDSSWPSEWLNKQWNEGYHITQVSCGGGKWLTVMSQGTGYTSQVTCYAIGTELSDFIKKYWDQDYYITAATFSSGKLYVVMSKGGDMTAQRYRTRYSRADFQEEVKKQWDEDYLLSLVETDGDGKYFFVMSKYASRTVAGQSYNIDPSNVESSIDKHWKEGRNVSYIGGNVDQSGKQTQTQTHKHNRNNTGNLVTCPRCQGTGRQKCIMCGGRGYQLMGFNKARCGTCNERGDFDCISCNQTGQITKADREKYFHRCLNCKGEGRATCIVCKGRGTDAYGNWCTNCYGNKTKCLYCYGLGWQTPSYGGGGSGLSGGGNRGGGNSGGGSGGNASGSCPTCHGSGVCTSCRGSGGKWENTGYYTGSGTQSWINCPSCNGNKRCFMCYGRGKL